MQDTITKTHNDIMDVSLFKMPIKKGAENRKELLLSQI